MALKHAENLVGLAAAGELAIACEIVCRRGIIVGFIYAIFTVQTLLRREVLV